MTNLNQKKASPALLLLCAGASARRGGATNKEMIEKTLMLRSYTMLEFIQKFCRRIENSLKHSLGLQFITKYCLQKYGSHSQITIKKDQVIDKKTFVQMRCFKRANAIQALKDNERLK